MIKKFIGWTMIIALYVALFVFIAIQASLIVAAIIFGCTVALFGFTYIAAWLVS